MKTPGPDHPITIEPAADRWRARLGSHVIADSNDALVLREASYPPRVYFPRTDVAMEYMTRTQKQTHCPYKGDAAYFTTFLDGEFHENLAWSYEAPFPAMEAIAGRICFYPERVELYEVDDAAVNPEHGITASDEDKLLAEKASLRPAETSEGVDDVVMHTDAGDGTSQREHWRANTEPTRTTDGAGLR
jgi:uncharacterized protein (DUF427 family)